MKSYEVYLQKLAELDQAAQDAILELKESIEKMPPVEGIQPLSKNMCVVRFSSLANLSAETHLIEVQKEAVLELLDKSPRQLDVVFKKLRTICEEGKIKRNGSYLYLHPEFVKYLTALLPEDAGQKSR